MKKVIIGIHGLGNKPPKYLLEKWWKDSIKEGFNKNGFKNELVDFELVYWADILYEKPLDKWEKDKDSPYFLDEPYKKSPKKIVSGDSSFKQGLIDFISSQLNKIFLNADKTLNYSFITDFILEKYFKDLNTYYIEECKDQFDKTCKAKHLIRKRIIEVINKYKGYEILIIAHSMGSIVAFDVLTFLLPETNIHTLVTIGSPLGLPVVVSKIAAEHKKNPNGHKYMATPPGVGTNWFNLADISDKVALNYKLNDDFSPNEKEVSPFDFLVVNDYEINKQKNPHKSFGYLRTPELSKILNEFINTKKKNFANKVADKLEQFIQDIKVQAEFVKDRLNIN
ncbi:PGAP1-like alpha/beta domain-containing protein [Roseimarinus sediminis]|uniref:PGAP1-like alpha/beta domain-containing protein n=1 Tax=Roseimarinus sediminis TaxID=1610899 RepID=UPI003D19CB89